MQINITRFIFLRIFRLIFWNTIQSFLKTLLLFKLRIENLLLRNEILLSFSRFRSLIYGRINLLKELILSRSLLIIFQNWRGVNCRWRNHIYAITCNASVNSIRKSLLNFAYAWRKSYWGQRWWYKVWLLLKILASVKIVWILGWTIHFNAFLFIYAWICLKILFRRLRAMIVLVLIQSRVYLIIIIIHLVVKISHLDFVILLLVNF